MGKSTFLRQKYTNADWIDLLKTDIFYHYASHPALLREQYQQKNLIIINEVQRIPDLMYENPLAY